MLTDAELDELERLEKGAISPTWKIKTYQEQSGEHVPYASWDVWDEDNMMLVVALRNAAPKLIAELRSARATIAEMRGRPEKALGSVDAVLSNGNGTFSDMALEPTETASARGAK